MIVGESVLKEKNEKKEKAFEDVMCGGMDMEEVIDMCDRIMFGDSDDLEDDPDDDYYRLLEQNGV